MSLFISAIMSFISVSSCHCFTFFSTPFTVFVRKVCNLCYATSSKSDSSEESDSGPESGSASMASNSATRAESDEKERSSLSGAFVCFLNRKSNFAAQDGVGNPLQTMQRWHLSRRSGSGGCGDAVLLFPAVVSFFPFLFCDIF